MKKVSIIIPIYNVEIYLRECLESVVHQTYTDLEIILIDDGSTDASAEIIDEYAASDRRVIAIHQKNQGVPAARNKGLDTAAGDYVLFADGDDVMMPDLVETLVDELEQNDAQLSIVEAASRREDCHHNGVLRILSPEETVKGMFSGFRKLRVTLWNKLFIRELIGDLRMDASKDLSEDILFTAQYLKNVQTVAYISSPLYLYRLRLGSAVRGGSKEALVEAKPLSNMAVVNAVCERFPDLKAMMLEWAVMDCIMWKRQLADPAAIRRMNRKAEELRKQAVFCGRIHWKTRLLYAMGMI